MRVAQYCRVSTEEQFQDGFSIPAQSRAIRQYCDAHGWQVIAEYADEGRSAWTDDLRKRPAFARMIADAKAGQFDVIVVHKLDRFARNLAVTLDTLAQLQRVGVAFVSLSEQMDFTTPIGKVILATLGAFAEYYSGNLSHEIRKGKAERKLQGLYNGILPFGYKRLPDRPEAVIDEATAPGVLLAFREAVLGRSDTQIARVLNAAGYRTQGTRGTFPWKKNGTRQLLMNRFYLGELPGGTPGKHPALVDLELFDAAQAARATNRAQQGAHTIAHSRQTYSLSGLLTCAHCLERPGVRSPKLQICSPHGPPRVRCASRAQGFACPQRMFPLEIYEDQVTSWLGEISIPDDAVERALVEHRKRSKNEPRADQEKRRLEARLARLKELYGWGDIGREEYVSERDIIVSQLRAFVPVERQKLDLERMASLLRSAAALWSARDESGKHELITQIVERVIVRDDRIETIVPRADCAPWLPPWQG